MSAFRELRRPEQRRGGLDVTRHGYVRAAMRPDAMPFGCGALAVAGLGAAHGGYFATAWGWAIVACCGLLIWVLSISGLSAVEPLEYAFIVSLLALGALVAASAAWGPSSAALDEAARVCVFVAGGVLAFLVTRKGAAAALSAGVLAGTVALESYAVASRLFPDHLGTFDSIAVYRLATPVGYWNGLGLLSAVAVLVAVSLAASAASPRCVALAALPVPVLLTALYFTFSRGSWIALGIGVAVAFALDPHRVRLTATVVAVGIPGALVVFAASRSAALTHLDSSVALASTDGHRLALLLFALSIVSALIGGALVFARRRWSVPPSFARLYTPALAAVTVVAVVTVVAYVGGPSAAARRVWHSFAAAPPKTQGNLQGRLFSFSGNGRADLYRVAWHDFEAHPLLGSGAGSYEAYWLAHRTTPLKVRDAHSLYPETLAETGIVGLSLLLVALGAPLVAAVRARRRPGVAAATGAYVAYLAGAAVDWDWEITSVTLAAIFVGVALLVSARPDEEREASPAFRYGALAVAVAIGAFGFVFLVGNMFLSRASAAASSGHWTIAMRDARRASSWLPWSTQPWQQLGEAQLAQGHPALAQTSFRTALKKNSGDWSLWFDLARASSGATQRAALAHASKLDPLSPEIATFRSELGAQNGISITAGGTS